ncbi:MAG: methyltransferase domain-containing protein [Niabella sp.]
MKIIDAVITTISTIRRPYKAETVKLAKLLKGKKGLEVGGPSSFFKRTGYYPVYLYAKSIDGVNFSTSTVWEGEIESGNTYLYLDDHKPGKQFIAEAATLEGIPGNSYDFLLSCHSLEHVANPIKALKRWHEVLKPGAWLCLVLPDKEETFDINRPYTRFEHLLDDFNNNIGEDDETHFKEVLDLHSIERDKGVSSYQELEERTKHNMENRCVHHHVFSFEVIKEMLTFCGFDTVLQKKAAPLHLITLAKKL